MCDSNVLVVDPEDGQVAMVSDVEDMCQQAKIVEEKRMCRKGGECLCAKNGLPPCCASNAK